MEPSSLADLEALVQVAETGTVVAAARALGLSPSALSRRLSRLESRLGASLAVRTTRSLALTDEGRRLVERAASLLAQLREAEDDVRRARARPSGSLVISASSFLGQQVIAPVLARFLEENPDVRARLLLEDRYVDLVKEGVDLAIRLGTSLASSSLLARRLGTQERWLCAAPSLLARHPAPRDLDELAAYRLLDLAHVSDRGRWAIHTPDGPRRLRVNARVESSSLAALHAMAIAGAGIAVLYAHAARDDVRAGRLIRVMSDHQLPPRAVWLVRARGRSPTPAMQRFAALLEPVIREGG